ncbi:preprotein translocase subunit SecE [Rhodococcoides corynebacterioides]|uniref:preprotein translocase subunit SecE n=1 Tax=Rhodococcoides corynebacterioides TaxID=53972 RepID=UPI001C9B8476|nr:preprotein translocase subunit SecE [Rhodococcus corynebacterioides]MBY6350918.1 preprotein translocase subunit SecE [Rhodococcus corynebacterioides]
MSDQREPRDDAATDGSTDLPGGDADAGTAGSSASSASARPTGKRAARRTRDTDSADGTAGSGKTTAGKSVATASQVPGRQRAEAAPKQNIFARLRRFLREVVAELRKVIWPNRKQMVTYTAVVLVFVTFMVAYISGLDLAFIRGVQWLFG